VLKDGAATAIAGAPYVSGAAITVDGMALHIKGAPADGDTFTTTPSMPDLDPFDALDRALAVLNDASAGAGQVSQAVSDGVRDLDALLGHFQAARSVAGAVLTRLDTIESRNQERNIIAKTIQSDAEDLDMVQAISDFQNRQTNYQAALQSYAMVQRMTLFDYLK
jgi:flagellar hook-associated protein 3 FlgL